MHLTTKTYEQAEKLISYVIMVSIAVVPLINIGRGIDVTDMGYSLSKYKAFFSEQHLSDISTVLSDFLGAIVFSAAPVGSVFAIHVMQWLSYSAVALMVYDTFKDSIPRIPLLFSLLISTLFPLAWVRYWNYQSITVLFLCTGLWLLVKSFKSGNTRSLLLSGFVMGVSFYARTPNILHLLFFAAIIWYYGFGKRSWGYALKRTGLFLASAAVAIIIFGILAVAFLGFDEVLGNLSGLLSVAQGRNPSQSSYSASEMLESLYNAVVQGVRFFFSHMIPPALFLCGMTWLLSKKWVGERLSSLLFLTSGLLFLIYSLRLGYRGGYSFPITAAASSLCLSVLISIVSVKKDPLLSTLLIISCGVVSIVPLGTNNDFEYIRVFLHFPLAAIASSGFWLHKYAVIKTPIFSERNWLSLPIAGCVILLITGITSGVLRFSSSVYRDRPYSELTVAVQHTDFMFLKTSTLRASQFQTYIDQLSPFSGKTQLTYGSFAIGYILTDLPPALIHPWPDIMSFTVDVFTQRLNDIAYPEKLPIVVLAEIDNMGKRSDTPEEREKRRLISEFLEGHLYVEFFRDEYFQMFAPPE